MQLNNVAMIYIFIKHSYNYYISLGEYQRENNTKYINIYHIN